MNTDVQITFGSVRGADMSKCDSVPHVALLLINHIWTDFQDNVKYTGKMVSGYTGIIISPCFVIERHAAGPKQRTWHYAGELKLETSTVLNSQAGIQFPKSNEEASFLFREP